MIEQSSNKPALLGTGMKGLVGSKFVELFQDSYQIESLDVSDPNRPVDITNLDDVKRALMASAADTVIHLAAFTDVTAAWEQRDDKSGLAYQVNVEGTRNLVTACRETGKYLLAVSTAFVFDGQKSDLYTETDAVNPIEWYGQTKAWSEEVILDSHVGAAIMRIDFPFRSDPFPKPDIVRKTVTAIEKGYGLFTNHYFGPTYLEDFAKVLDWGVRTKPLGIWHASSGEQWSDFQLGEALHEILSLKQPVKAGDLDEYLVKLNRPYQRNTAMSVEKLKAAIDFKLTPISKALKTVQV
jgi:dTDP-4-dehydrorhamnose reductase